jgi:carbon starvation protein
LYHKKTGNLKGASIAGFILILAAVFTGPYIQNTIIGDWLTLDSKTLSIILPIYAFFAAALPVWLLLAPRDYLSSFMKIGVFIALILGVFVVNPDIPFPAVTEFVNGGGPILAGPVHFHYDRMRRNFRFPRLCWIWYNTKNDRSME